MKLKVYHTLLGNKVVTLENDGSIGELESTIQAAFGGNVSLKSIRFGYPPQTLEIESNTADIKLDDLGISSGEKITIETAKILATSHPVVKSPKLKENEISLDDIWPSSYLRVHTVPDDNSCLFHAISYCIYRDISLSQQLRDIVASEIIDNKEEYSDAILGRSNKDYAEWISQSTSWGGGIEIAILSKYMSMSVFVLDVDAGRYEKFNEEKFDKFIMIVFNGVHYDAMELCRDDTREIDTVFDQREENIELVLQRAQDVALRLKKSGYSFNTQRDKIKCNVCLETLIGEREVARHAEKTGHVDFGQSS